MDDSPELLHSGIPAGQPPAAAELARELADLARKGGRIALGDAP